MSQTATQIAGSAAGIFAVWRVIRQDTVGAGGKRRRAEASPGRSGPEITGNRANV